MFSVRRVVLALVAVLAFALLAVADDGSVAWPVANQVSVLAGTAYGGWQQVAYPPTEPWTFAVLSGHTSEVYAISFSPDGSLLATGEVGQVYRLWDTRTWREVCSIVLPRDLELGTACPQVLIAWHPNGKLLALGTSDYGAPVYLWNIETGEVRTFPTGGLARTQALVFSPDGTLLAGNFPLLRGAELETTIVWDLDSGQVLHILPSMFDLAFTPDGKYLVGALVPTPDPSPAFRSRIVFWEVGTWREARVFEGFWAPFAVSPDGRYMVAPEGLRGPLVLLEVATGEVVARLDEDVRRHGLSGHEFGAVIDFSSDGREIAFVGRDRALYFWKWMTGEVLRTPAALVRAAALSPDGRFLASSSRGELTVEIWDKETFRLVARLPGQQVGLWGEWTSLCASPDGTILAATSRSEVFFWDLLEGRLRGSLRFPGLVAALSCHPQKDLLAVGGEFGSQAVIMLLDVRTSERLFTLEGHRHGVFALEFAPGGDRLASGGADGWVRLWDAVSGEGWAEFHTDGHVVALSFSPEGSLLVAAAVPRYWGPMAFPCDLGCAGAVSVWDVATGELLYTWKNRSGPFAFSPNGRYLAMAGAEGVEIVDVTSAFPVVRMGEPGEAPLRFTPDGRYLITRSQERVQFRSFPDGAVVREIPIPGTGAIVLDVRRGLLYTALTAYSPRGGVTNLGAVVAWYVGDLLAP